MGRIRTWSRGWGWPPSSASREGGTTIDSEHVAVTLKHFAGHGQSEGGRNIAPLSFGDREIRTNHLYPFEMAVKVAHAHSIMASYNEWDGVPNHANHKLLTDILRNEWGFKGFVMSDGGGIDVVYEDHHAAASYADAGILCLEAGVDYDLGGKGRCFSTLAAEARAGKVSMAAIDRAASGVLCVKFLCGLFDHPYVDADRAAKVTNSPEHRALAREAADEAMILLKNDRHVLPFDASKIKTLAVIGPNAAEIHLGGYSAVPMEGVSVLQGLKDFGGRLDEGPLRGGLQADGQPRLGLAREREPGPERRGRRLPADRRGGRRGAEERRRRPRPRRERAPAPRGVERGSPRGPGHARTRGPPA